MTLLQSPLGDRNFTLSVSDQKYRIAQNTERPVIVRTEKASPAHSFGCCMQKLNANFAASAHWIREHDLSPIRSGNFSNVRRILTLHFIPGGA